MRPLGVVCGARILWGTWSVLSHSDRNKLIRFYEKSLLQLLVEFAGRAGNKNPAGDATFPVLHTLHDAGGFATLGAVGALGRVHHFFAVGCFGNFGHL